MAGWNLLGEGLRSCPSQRAKDGHPALIVGRLRVVWSGGQVGNTVVGAKSWRAVRILIGSVSRNIAGRIVGQRRAPNLFPQKDIKIDGSVRTSLARVLRPWSLSIG